MFASLLVSRTLDRVFTSGTSFTMLNNLQYAWRLISNCLLWLRINKSSCCQIFKAIFFALCLQGCMLVILHVHLLSYLVNTIELDMNTTH